MEFELIRDLDIVDLSNSWFLLKDIKTERKYLYNNESCELGALPDIRDAEIDFLGCMIANTKKVISKPISSPKKYLERKETPRLMLFLTASCNLRCVYCHCSSESTKANMSDSYAMDVIEKYLQYVNEYTGNIDDIEITFMGGGEPFLRINTIKKIVKYIKEMGIKGEYVIVTNATIGSNSDWNWLLKNNFRITISADGPPVIQNKQRVFAKKTSLTSDYVDQRLEYLTHANAKINLRSTVMDVSEKSVDMICNYYQRFSCVNTHHLEPVSFAGRGEFQGNISKDEFYKQFFANYSKYLYLDPKRYKSAWFKPFKKSQGFCGAVYFNAVVTHDGFVSLCSEVDSSALTTKYGDDYIVGKIEDKNPFLTDKSRSFSRKNSIDNIPECRTCIIRYKCGGGCYVKRDRDFTNSKSFYNSFCQNVIKLNMSYLIWGLENVRQ